MIKKIAFVIGNFNHRAGTERCTALIANGLIKCGYNVSVISISEGLNPAFEVDSDIELLSLHLEKLKSKNKYSYKKNLYKSLKNIVKKYAFDLVVAVDVILYSYLHFIKRSLKCKTIAWEHFNCTVERGSFIKLSRRLAVKSADKIVVLGKKDLENYKNKYKKINNITYIYNPIAYNFTNNINVDNKKIIAVGRLVEQKGFARLIEIWKNVEPVMPDWELNIYGEGSLRLELQNKIDGYALKNIKLCGNNKNLEEAYNRSSIFVLTSIYEGFVLVLLEAQAKGLPCVSFNCKEGPCEIIDDNVNGYLIEDGNINEFSNKLIDLMNNSDLRQKFSNQSQKDLYRFKIENVIKQWVNLIESFN